MSEFRKSKWTTLVQVAGFVCASLLFSTPNARATPTPATGTTKIVFDSYSGSTSGIAMDISENTHTTGEISFSLDPAIGADSFYLFDWDAGTASIQLHLLINAPLFAQLGLGPVSLVINESGNFGAAPLVEPGMSQNVLFPPTILMTGGGTVEAGVFAGVEFFNDNVWVQVNNSAPVDVTVGAKITVPVTTSININSQHSGTITQPGFTSQSTQGVGSGTVNGVPEPQTLHLLLVGLAGFWLIKQCKQKDGVKNVGHSSTVTA